MTARSRLTVVLNPIAGQGRGRRRLERTIELMRRGANIEVCATAATGEGVAAARAAAARGVDAVVAAGGDGTINEVVNGLAGSQVPLGVIPLGTANVLAAELGIPDDPQALTELLLRGPVRPIWVGRADGRRFVAMASAGFDTDVVRDVDSGLKRRLGKGAFVLAAVLGLLRFVPKRLRVTAGGRTVPASQVLVAKAAKYGGNFVAAPAVSVDRPEFCVFAVQAPTRMGIVGLAVALARGRLATHPAVTMLSASEVSLACEGEAAAAVQADGELIGRLPMRIAIDPEQVRMIAPLPA